MSDYVSRLVARSTGAAKVVRPETASLFEPRGAAPQQLLDGVDVETSVPPQRTSAGAPDAVAGSPADLAAALVSADHLDPAQAEPAPPNADARAASETPARVSPRLPREESSHGGPVLALPEPTKRTTAAVIRAESRAPRFERSLPEQRTAAVGTDSPEALSTAPPVSPRPARDEPPVVRVTIGRVDVRAVQAAPTVPPAALRDREPEAPPRQTLGEYLKKGARP